MMRSAFVTCTLVLIAGSACSSILGIEELDPALSADGGSGGGSGDSGSNESGGMTGAGGTSGSGGSATGGATGSGGTSTGGASTGGASGSGGSGAGGDAADAGGDASDPDAAPSTTVEGKVVDYYLQPVPSVPVTIGSATVLTASDGSFSVPDVGATYDASLAVTVPRPNGQAIYGWRYEGLTRRDPTLQVYQGRPERDATVYTQITNHAMPLDTNKRKIGMAFGSAPDGGFSTTLSSEYTYVNAYWRCAETTTGTAHTLLWEFSGSQSLPTSYLAEDTRPLALSASMEANVVFDMDPTGGVPSGSLSGTVTNAGPTDRQNHLFVHYTDGASIEIVDEWDAPDVFTYVVPTVADAGITAAATAGYTSGPYAVAFADDLVAGQSGIALDIPAPATVLAPTQGAAGVGPTTEFRWTGGEPVSLLWVESKNYYEAVFVVTVNKETTLGELGLRSGESFYWYVENHGSFATVDDAAGPDGFLSPYASGYPAGPRRGSGTYTMSASRGFTSE